MTIAQHTITAAVAVGVSPPAPIAVIKGELSLDTEWSPYARIDLTAPATPALIALDPRTDEATLHLALAEASGLPGQLAQVSADYLGDYLGTMGWPGKVLNTFSTVYSTPFVPGAPWRSSQRRAALKITRRVHHREQGTVTLTALSREIDAQGARATAPIVYTATNLNTLAHAVLGGPVQGSSPLSLTGMDLTRDAGQSAWRFLEPFVDEAGQRLWCDELGTWRLTSSTLTGIPRPDLDLTQADDIIDITSGDYADHVILTHRHTAPDGTTVESVASAAAGTQRGLAITRTTRVTGIRPAATHILTRALTRGRRARSTAVARYDINPGDTVPGDGQVTAITWDLADHVMTLTTRD